MNTITQLLLQIFEVCVMACTRINEFDASAIVRLVFMLINMASGSELQMWGLTACYIKTQCPTDGALFSEV